MAMAPMQTVREAVTKAFTNCLSPSLPVFRFSHSPKRSKPFSMPISSPMTVPMARQSTTSMDLPLTRVLPSILSMPCMAPAMAMNRVLTPQAVVRDCCCSCFRSLPVKWPISPPRMMAALLITVPSPTICCHSMPGILFFKQEL